MYEAVHVQYIMQVHAGYSNLLVGCVVYCKPTYVGVSIQYIVNWIKVQDLISAHCTYILCKALCHDIIRTACNFSKHTLQNHALYTVYD